MGSSDRYELARAVLSRIGHAVAIVGASHGAERSCGTGTCMYVSLSPAMIAIAEHTGSRTTRLIRESGEFSVSLLHETQQDLAAAAGKSAPGPDKFATLGIRAAEPPAGLGAPAVDGSLAIVWCRVVQTLPTGDHLLFVGEVVSYLVSDAKARPLLRFGRRYARLGEATSEESPEGYPT